MFLSDSPTNLLNNLDISKNTNGTFKSAAIASANIDFATPGAPKDKYPFGIGTPYCLASGSNANLVSSYQSLKLLFPPICSNVILGSL